MVVGLIIVLAIVAVQLFSERILYAFDRIYDSEEATTTNAWEGRLGTFSLLLNYENWFEFLFGRGYGVINEGEWYASIPYYFSGTGFLGIVAVALLFVFLYFSSNKLQKKFLLVFFILCFVSEVLMNYWLIFIIPLLLSGEKGKTSFEK